MCFDIYLECGSLNDVEGAEKFDREQFFFRVKKWVLSFRPFDFRYLSRSNFSLQYQYILN